MKILVVNAGSSSLKYQLIDMENETVLVKGLCERIGTAGSITHKVKGATPYEMEYPMPSHKEAIGLVLSLLTDAEHGVIASVDEIDAVGHRVAHGGEKYRTSTIIDESVLKYLEEIVPINPLHGPPAIAGMRACLEQMADKTQVAVFDTSFYADIEDFRYIYPLPLEYYEKYKIRKYGFHGTSHRYVAAKVAHTLGKDIKDLKIITCHLGNGSSVTAVKNGIAIDTSMGFTPQDGVVMGTRSGALDPTVITYIMKNDNLTAEQMDAVLNKQSGLLGISGLSNDLRNIGDAAKNGNDRAILARKMLANSVKKLIGTYFAELNGLDVLVFTAGIGENDKDIRQMICADMDALGIAIDETKNMTSKGDVFEISDANAAVRTFVVATDEELMIARDTAALV